MQTHAQIRAKIFEMMKDDEALMRRKLETALKSGAFDPADYQDDYRLPKIIYYAILIEMSDQRIPLEPGARREAINIRACI